MRPRRKVFSMVAPSQRNIIPVEVRLGPSLTVFHKALKHGFANRSGDPRMGWRPCLFSLLLAGGWGILVFFLIVFVLGFYPCKLQGVIVSELGSYINVLK